RHGNYRTNPRAVAAVLQRRHVAARLGHRVGEREAARLELAATRIQAPDQRAQMFERAAAVYREEVELAFAGRDMDAVRWNAHPDVGTTGRVFGYAGRAWIAHALRQRDPAQVRSALISAANALHQARAALVRVRPIAQAHAVHSLGVAAERHAALE